MSISSVFCGLKYMLWVSPYKIISSCNSLKRMTRFELATFSLGSWRSTTELHPQMFKLAKLKSLFLSLDTFWNESLISSLNAYISVFTVCFYFFLDHFVKGQFFWIFRTKSIPHRCSNINFVLAMSTQTN